MTNEERDKLLLELLLERQVSKPATSCDFPLERGCNVIVRTVTMYYTGRVKSCDNLWLVLEDAAWLPGWSSGPRWADLLANGKPSEVEPYPGGCVVGVGSIIDVSTWNHKLPRDQK